MIIAASILSINFMVFIVAFIRQTDALTDFTYCMSFVLGTWLAYYSSPSTTSLCLSSAITLWALRLGLYLAYRVHLTGRDRRFDTMRKSFVKFGSFWFLQGVSVCIIMLPFILCFPEISKTALGWLISGLIFFILGLGIESIADYQKFKFRRSAHVDEFCNVGLWRLMQHPNYFGEIICWWSLTIALFPYFSGWTWLSFLGPIWITILLSKISGIPLLQESWMKKYGHLDSFKQYQKNTPLIIPKFINFR